MVKFILGGGIAGLLCAFYLKDYTIISDNLGGQNSEDFSLGPRLIKVDEYTTKLLKDLNIQAEKVIYKIGYKEDKKIYSSIPQGFKEKYVQHTRELDNTENSHLSSGESSVECYDFDYQKLVKTLIDKTKTYVIGKVKNIEYDKITFIDSFFALNYNKLISTLPLPLFYKISDQEHKVKDFDTFDTTFVLIESEKQDDISMSELYNYIYIVDEPFHRKTFLKREYKNKIQYILEYKGVLTATELTKIFMNFYYDVELIHDVKQIKVIPRCQIKQSKNILQDNITGTRFLGRYAQWNHQIKINELLKEIHERLNG